MTHQHKYFILLLVIILTVINKTTAQTSAYHSIVFPYDANYRQIMTAGGIISANPDPISGIQLNSAGLAFFNQPFLFFSYSIQKVNYNIDYEYFDDDRASSNTNSNPGFISFILPFSIIDKKVVLSGAFQGIGSSEIEVWNQIYADQEPSIQHSRKGAVSKTDLAISSQLFKRLGIGLGISKWSGNWSWNDQSALETIGYGRFNYTGTSFNLALLYQWSKVKIGLSFYSPFQLMTSSKINTKTWFLSNQQNFKQRFNGAVRFGLIYFIRPELSIGIDYRWQDKITIKSKYADSLITPKVFNYGESHQVSLVFGKDFYWHLVKLPFYIGYQFNLMPITPDDYTMNYQQIEVTDGHNEQHSVITGLNILYKSYGLYLSAGWKTGSVYIYDLYHSAPPWS